MSTANERLYDLSLIEEMAGGDEDFMKELAETFVSSVPPVVAMMTEACANGDWSTMGKEAHSLKSNIETLQIRSLSAEIRAIEAAGKHGLDLDKMPELVERVKSIMLEAIEQIKEQYGLS